MACNDEDRSSSAVGRKVTAFFRRLVKTNREDNVHACLPHPSAGRAIDIYRQIEKASDSGLNERLSARKGKRIKKKCKKKRRGRRNSAKESSADESGTEDQAVGGKSNDIRRDGCICQEGASGRNCSCQEEASGRNCNCQEEASGRNCSCQEEASGRNCNCHEGASGRNCSCQEEASGRNCSCQEEASGRNCNCQEEASGRNCSCQEEASGRNCNCHEGASGRNCSCQEEASGRNCSCQEEASGRNCSCSIRIDCQDANCKDKQRSKWSKKGVTSSEETRDLSKSKEYIKCHSASCRSNDMGQDTGRTKKKASRQKSKYGSDPSASSGGITRDYKTVGKSGSEEETFKAAKNSPLHQVRAEEITVHVSDSHSKKIRPKTCTVRDPTFLWRESKDGLETRPVGIVHKKRGKKKEHHDAFEEIDRPGTPKTPPAWSSDSDPLEGLEELLEDVVKMEERYTERRKHRVSSRLEDARRNKNNSTTVPHPDVTHGRLNTHQSKTVSKSCFHTHTKSCFDEISKVYGRKDTSSHKDEFDLLWIPEEHSSSPAVLTECAPGKKQNTQQRKYCGKRSDFSGSLDDEAAQLLCEIDNL